MKIPYINTPIIQTMLSAMFLVSVSTGQANEAFNELTAQINDQTYQQMTSVVVNHQGQMIYERYFNGADANTQHDMRSASKSITSLAIGLAIQDGLLTGVEQTVVPLFPDKQPLRNPDPRKTALRIEDLLTMSSVLECNDWNSASRGQEERMYLIEDWSAFILGLPIRGIPPWEQPAAERKYGRAFSYCTGGVQLLADVVERVTKQPMSGYLQTKLFQPLGIAPPVFSQTPLGVTNGGGGMRMTSRDWIKIGQLMMNQGQVNGQTVLNAAWINASFQRRAVIDAERDIEYGYLWWINDFTVNDQTITTFAAAGNGGNYLFMIPEFKAQVVITSTAYNTPYMHRQSQEILTKHVIPVLLGR
ncbi:serine hydrolase domain-containing protein [Marinicella meishanensis]|uniref:serine hydrolase domain-containing protein n=1 Tax=Marinicella meishanensis TaxID=2873263 RepID=UPI001CBD8FEF|nr:serine hydrolase [Marinicella sp. NBU2979]